jgi:hypothetical protein
MRLMGRKSLGPQWEFLPVLGIHHLYLAPGSRDVSCRQAGAKDLNQVGNEDLPSLLQQSRKYPIRSRSFVWGEGINRPLHSSVSHDLRSHFPIQAIDAASDGGCHSSFNTYGSGEVSSKQEVQGFLLGLCTQSRQGHQGTQPDFRTPR